MLNIDYKKRKIILIRIECKKRGFIYEILYELNSEKLETLN